LTIGTELEVIQSNALTADLTIGRPPAIVLDEAREAARVLRDVISQKDKPVIFNGQQYLEFEDWQTVGRFYGVTARVRETRLIHIGEGDSMIIGYEAAADAVLVSSGQIISAGEAMCLNDEEKWSTRPKYEWQTNEETGRRQRVKIGEERVPLFQLRSMAQTRACAKALRNVLSWVVVLAGYRPTPAEEMTGNESSGEEDPSPSKTTRPRMPESKKTPVPVPPPAPKSGNGGTDVVISDGQRKRFFAIWKGTGVPEDIVKTKLQEYGYTSSTQIKRSDYEELCSWAANFGRHSETRSDYDDTV
jgi:hypothetical protein